MRTPHEYVALKLLAPRPCILEHCMHACPPTLFSLRMQGSSVPICIPGMPIRKKQGPGAPADEQTYPGTFVPPHEMQDGQQDAIMFSLTGNEGVKRDRLRARNAILQSTGFLEKSVEVPPTIGLQVGIIAGWRAVPHCSEMTRALLCLAFIRALFEHACRSALGYQTPPVASLRPSIQRHLGRHHVQKRCMNRRCRAFCRKISSPPHLAPSAG
jgi:hypothetical protein